MYKIHLLPASFGDSILVEYGDEKAPKYFMIDGGPYFAFEGIIAAVKRVAPKMKRLEMLIATHVDIDHIDGLIRLLMHKPLPFEICGVLYNGHDQLKTLFPDLLGMKQGEYFQHLVKENGIQHNIDFAKRVAMVEDFNHLPEIPLPGGMKLTVLGPSREGLKKLLKVWEKEMEKSGSREEILKKLKDDHRYQPLGDELGGDAKPDDSPANRSSISLLATYGGKTCLFAGDAPSDCLLEAIEPMLKKADKKKLEVSAWKLAHHGSRKSTLEDLMEKIDTPKVLVSTDGTRYKHPDADCINGVLKSAKKEIEFYFNYESERNRPWLAGVPGKYTSRVPDEKDAGITVEL